MPRFLANKSVFSEEYLESIEEGIGKARVEMEKGREEEAKFDVDIRLKFGELKT